MNEVPHFSAKACGANLDAVDADGLTMVRIEARIRDQLEETRRISRERWP